MLVHLDGFDSYSVAADLAMEYTASISSFSTSTGRFGGGAITLSPTTQFQKSIAPTSEVWVGYAAKLTGWSTAYSNPLAQLLASGNQNTVGQVLTSLSQVFTKMSSQSVASAVASE